jgi:phosphoglycolate phosphatase
MAIITSIYIKNNNIVFMKNKIIIFDFDGVIVNTCQIAFDINKEVYTNLNYEEFQDWQEGNIFKKKMIETIDDYSVRDYIEHYSERIRALLPVGGLESLLADILSLGYKIVIISSSSEEVIKEFLKGNKLDKYFTEIMGYETDLSKVKKFEMVFKKYKIKASETLMVTDSVGDVKEAHEIKVKAIGVTWGIHEKKRLEKNGADFVAEKPSEVLVGIKKILALK